MNFILELILVMNIKLILRMILWIMSDMSIICPISAVKSDIKKVHISFLFSPQLP